ncbi:MAG TPA: rRNA maturation RNase YbeY [Gemmatimonadales bacterium]|nr:rRNA maturation RNase YbeY [Gemmatimonadales bacterium]
MGGRRRPLADATVRRVVQGVLAGERRAARISVTFLGRDAMTRLNERYKGRRRPTDVIAFTLTDPVGGVVGDVYICPWVAAREAAARRIPLRQEVIRLLIHGTLHVLGHDHPEDESRTRSPMWRRQERYLEALS